MSKSNNDQSNEKAEKTSDDGKVQSEKEINQTQKKEEKELSIEDKLKEAEEKLLRSLAEIENQRRRFEKEIKDAFEFGSFNFAKEILSIPDNLQRAREAIKNDEKLKTNKDLDRFLENIKIVEKDLISIFEKNRIIRIVTENKRFDPNFHQAMTEIEDEKTEPGTILQEIQSGYMFGERLLRPSLVGVSKKPSKEQGNKDKKEEK